MKKLIYTDIPCLAKILNQGTEQEFLLNRSNYLSVPYDVSINIYPIKKTEEVEYLPFVFNTSKENKTFYQSNIKDYESVEIYQINFPSIKNIENDNKNAQQTKKTNYEKIIKLNDIANHVKVMLIKHENNKEKVVTENLAYFGDGPRLTLNANVIATAFVEAICEKDFELAQEYLSANLKEELSADILQSFFENFNEFYVASQNTIFLDNGKNFCFEIAENKITEISQY
ncbi:MAG: hypothetical protein RR140_02870 [Clostridia bacterium]